MAALNKKVKNRKITLREYLRFLTVTNAFANHRQKLFRKIEGSNFRI